MALHNRYDTIIVGHNYPALILSRILVKSNPELLMIDDERVTIAADWAQELSLLDVKLLKKIGEVYELAPLKNLDHYLQVKPWYVKLGTMILRLGSSGNDNLHEIQRKLNQDKLQLENFDQLFNEYCDRVINDIWNLKVLKNWDTVLLSTPIDESLAKVLHQLEKLVSFTDTTAALSYLMQATHHRYVSNNLSLTQKRFLSLRLISPRYVLDQKKLTKDLDLVCGHSVKQSLIKNWQFRANEKSVLLESYEGVVKSKNILYVGEFYKDLPFIFKVPSNVYSACRLKLKSNQAFFPAFAEQEFTIINETYLGRKIPFLKFSFINGNEVQVDFPLTQVPGDKLVFNLEEIKNLVITELQHFVPGIQKDFFNFDLTAGKEGYLEMIDFNLKKAANYEVGELNFGELMEIPAPLKMYKLKDLDYWGQFRGNYLGLFSFFIEAKLTFDRQK